MMILDRHDGDFGIGSWVDCRQCLHDRTQAGWFAIKAGEGHYEDRATYQHFHADCAEALVNTGLAEYRAVPSRRSA